MGHTSPAGRFWDETERHHDLAEHYGRNIEVTHPDSITSNGKCSGGRLLHHCNWCVTKVTYYEYRGESVRLK